MNLIALIKERAKYYKCLACSQALADCDVRLLTESQAHCTVEVTCGRCGVSFVAVLLKSRKHPDGLPERAPQQPISGDELLEVHQQLKELGGPLNRLFRNSSN